MDEATQAFNKLMEEFRVKTTDSQKLLESVLEETERRKDIDRIAKKAIAAQEKAKHAARIAAAKQSMQEAVKRWQKAFGKIMTALFVLNLAKTVQGLIGLKISERLSDSEEGEKRSKTRCISSSIKECSGKGGISWKVTNDETLEGSLTVPRRIRAVVATMHSSMTKAGCPTAFNFGAGNREYYRVWLHATIDAINQIEQVLIENTQCKTVDQKHCREYYDGFREQCMDKIDGSW